MVQSKLLKILGVIFLLSASGQGMIKQYQRKKRIQTNLKSHPVTHHITLKAGPADFNTGVVEFIGTATAIIRYGGFTVLTDPNFLHEGDRIHLGYGLTAKRLTNPAIELEQLPPVDLVILSHLAEDHFDRLVQKKLDHGVPIITTHHAARALTKLGFEFAYGLEAWESLSIRKGEGILEVTAMPGKHGSGALSALLSPVNGAMLSFGKQNHAGLYHIYLTGDTLIHNNLEEIPRYYPDIDLALLHLGGTRVLGVTVTMDSEQGVKMLQIVAPHKAIPIHYNDYDIFQSPLGDFKKAVQKVSLKDKIHYMAHGDLYHFHPKGVYEPAIPQPVEFIRAQAGV